ISAGLNSYFGLTGRSYKADDKTLPRSPKETFALSATWTDTLNEDWEWYVRGDATYAGKTYTDETNLSWVAAYSLLNGRVGFAREDGLNVELFCRNCLNEDGWRTGRRGVDWIDTSPVPNTLTRVGAIVQPIEKREIGLRVQFEF
ncbi:MAG: TonB-dependent receptor, partial [Gammaproteobacteria bacterium]|nr:TonB-dependent receptor [Gammaproteobacteria bacterium]